MKSFENWNIYILGLFEEMRTNSDIWRTIFNQVCLRKSDFYRHFHPTGFVRMPLFLRFIIYNTDLLRLMWYKTGFSVV